MRRHLVRSPSTTALTLALGATALFSTMHALVRYTSAGLHPFEIAFLRSLFGLAAVMPLVLRIGPSVLVSRNPRLLVLRGLVGGGSLLSWFYALSVVPIAAATALSFTSAIFSSLGATLLLGEKMGVRRWSAVLLGFAGTLVIVRPGFAVVHAGSLLVLVSAVLWGAGTVIVKRVARSDETVTIVVWTAVGYAVVSALPAAWVWQWPTPRQFVWLAFIGLLGTTGTLAWTHALKLADATLVVPTDFTRLVWAAALGFVAFGEVPDRWTWTGAALIIGSTAYIGWREARLARAGRLIAPPLPAAPGGAPASSEPAATGEAG